MIRGSEILHICDKYLGIVALPLVRCMLGWRRPKKKTRTLLVIAIAPIGDSVLLGKVVQSFQNHNPEVAITTLINKETQQVFDILGIKRKDLLVEHRPSFLSELIDLSFDVIIDTHQWARVTACLACLPRATLRVGFNTPKQYRKWAFNRWVTHRSDRHEIDNFKALFQSAYLFEMLDNPPLYFSKKNKLPKPYIIFHPWASGFKHHMRECPILFWNTLARRWVKKGCQVVFTGSSSNCIRQVDLEKQKGVIFKAGKFSLEETLSLIEESEGVITVNTGIMHLAALCDVPILALHGPTKEVRWGPLSTKALCIYPKGEGRGFLNLGFEYPKNAHYTMDRISVKDVERAFEKLQSQQTV